MRDECLLGQSAIWLSLVCEPSAVSAGFVMLHLCHMGRAISTVQRNESYLSLHLSEMFTNLNCIHQFRAEMINFQNIYNLSCLTKMQHSSWKHSVSTHKNDWMVLTGCDILQHFSSAFDPLKCLHVMPDGNFQVWMLSVANCGMPFMGHQSWAVWMLLVWCCWAAII